VRENLNLNESFLYKNLQIHEKTISLILNKQFNDISLSELKQLWISNIEIYCNKFENYIDKELNESANDLYNTELLSIKLDLKNLKKHKDINKLKTKEALFEYWPQILMPAPSFVKIQS
jgi:hypothetical protein